MQKGVCSLPVSKTLCLKMHKGVETRVTKMIGPVTPLVLVMISKYSMIITWRTRMQDRDALAKNASSNCTVLGPLDNAMPLEINLNAKALLVNK